MNTLISFKLAKLLTHTDFDQKHANSGYIISTGELSFDHIVDWLNGKSIAAPTIAEVVMWLYEKHGIWIYAKPVLDEDGEWIFKCYIKLMNNFKAKEYQTKTLRSPAEAYEAAITFYFEAKK